MFLKFQIVLLIRLAHCDTLLYIVYTTNSE